MKNILISLSLFLVLTGFGAFVFLDTAGAQNDLVTGLLDLPAPPPSNPLVKPFRRERDENFYSKKTPPGDDAPIEDLLDYWQSQSANYQDLGYNIKPSEKTLERLMEAVEKDPNRLGGLVNVLPATPESAEFVKRIYDSIATKETASEDEYLDQSETVRDWLKYHSPYYSDELLEGSRGVGDADEYVTNQDELLALAKVDFSKAQPILNRLYNDTTQPVSQTLARWALYRHALETDSLGDIERYRDELKAAVENKSASAGQRDLALDALTQEKDWAGRDDWYYELLEDETLADLRINGRSYTGLTTIVLMSPPEKYIDRMLELLKSSNQTVRNAAVRNLGLMISKDHPEVVEALLPWLDDPNWAKGAGGERGRIVEALQAVNLPASVPGLIGALDEKAKVEPQNQNANFNIPMVAMSNSNIVRVNMNQHPMRSPAILALATQKDIRAVPALRRVLPEVEEYERHGVVRAIYMSHGYSIDEQVDALETNARANEAANANARLYANSNLNMRGFVNASVTSEDVADGPVYSITNGNSYVYRPSRPVSGDDIRSMLGGILLEITEAEEPLVNRVLERIAVLERREPQVAQALRRILQNWNGPAINAMMLRDLRNGKATIDSIVKLLSLRTLIVEKQASAVYEARGGPPLAAGIAACMINNNNDYDGILGGENVELKITTLACARLVRADLPVEKIAEFMGSPNKTLATAAERYLESNDSPEARRIVLSFHPDEAKIMGATTNFAPGGQRMTSSDFLPDLFASLPGGNMIYPYYLTPDFTAGLRNTEKRLQKEVRENPDLLGIYAYDDNFIRMYKDRAVFSWEDDSARYYERTLTPEEFEGFKGFLAANRVDTLPPFFSEPSEEEADEPLELLMLGKQGGRRVFMNGGEVPEFFERLDSAFEEMREPPAKLHYWLEKDVPGLEILYADENLQAGAVWKNGDDLRVMIDDQALREQIDKDLGKQEMADASVEGYDYQKGYELNQKRRAARQYEHLSWRKYDREKLSEVAAQPPGFSSIPLRDNFPVNSSTELWKARAGAVELRSDNEGLYKISRGQMTKLRSTFYTNVLISTNGRWAIGTRYNDEGRALVRINLLTNKEFKIILPNYPLLEAHVFVPSVNRLLIRGASYTGGEDQEPQTGTFFFLDPETGAFEPVKGEVQPLVHQTYRALQPTTVPDEYWAAIADPAKNETAIGIYNSRALSFKPLQKIPRIAFNSMDMWVDEKENKIYLVYLGHLLSLPLKKL